jgi:hypothetical protein
MVEAFQKKQGNKVQVFCQEPGYSTVDKEFLPSLGITLLDDPKGFLEIDENTLVMSVNPNVCVKQIVADL